jgi:hypothetical protein
MCRLVDSLIREPTVPNIQGNWWQRRPTWQKVTIVVVGGLVVLIALFRDDDTAEPVAVATTPTTGDLATIRTAGVPPTTALPAPATTTSRAPPATEPPFDPARHAAAIEASLLESLGIDTFTDACPDVEWACYIANIEAPNESIVIVTEQVEDDPAFGEDAAQAICNFLVVGDEFAQLEDVVVDSASGLEIGDDSREHRRCTS